MRRLMLGVVFVLVAAGCSKSNAVDVQKPQDQDVTNLGAPCDAADTSGYCGGGACVAGICRQKCGTDAECKGSVCLNDKAGSVGGCRLPSEGTCSAAKPCPSALLTCGQDDTCRVPCTASQPCPRNDQICIEGACFGTSEEGSSAWACDGKDQGSYQCLGAKLQVCDVGDLGWVDVATCDSAALCTNGRASGACAQAACSPADNACEGAQMTTCSDDQTKLNTSTCASAALCEQGLASKACAAPACAVDELNCQGAVLRGCKADRTGWDTLGTCETAGLCADSVAAQSATCMAPACDVGERKCVGKDIQVCNAARDGWVYDATCVTEALCADGLMNGGIACMTPTCAPDDRKCDLATMQTCNAGQDGWDDMAVCASGALCTAGLGAGACAASACSPGELKCDVDNKTLLVCNANLTDWDVSNVCSFVCLSAGTAHCGGVCTPGDKQCAGDVPQTCDNTGAWQGSTACSGSTPTCCNGECKLAATAIQAGDAHSCTLLSDGTAWCWGNNAHGELGNSAACTPPCSVPTPIKVALSSPVTQISGEGSATHVCAITDTATLWCWGYNYHGEVNGTSTPQYHYDPVQVGVTDVSRVSASRTNTCAVTSSSALWCWGSNMYGQMGDGTTDYGAHAPTQVNVDGLGVSRVLASQPCAFAGKMRTYCWGPNDVGEVGVGDTSSHTVPVFVTGLGYNDNAQLAGDSGTNCVRKQLGSVLCWGHNGSGQLGNNDSTLADQSAPVSVYQMANAKQISVGAQFACALLTNGELWCWGANSVGQLGDGTILGPRLAPVRSQQTVLASSITQVSAGGQHTCAIKTDGTVWCWGANSNGELGDGTTAASASAVQVKGLGTCE